MRHFITVRTEGIVLFVLFALITSSSFAQLSGIKTIPGNYATITAAVNALNAQGVGAGGVTFNVAAGNTETLTARINLTATGTASNPIVFQKSGSGANPKITAFAGIASGSSATPDGIWSLKGSDYVTINGIDLFDPNTSSATTMMEYGFGLFRNTAYDGARFNTIKNCTVTLNGLNNSTGVSPMPYGSTCVLVINSIPTAATSAFVPFDSTGTNSYNNFYSNVLQNCNNGIYITGSSVIFPYDLGDHGNNIGGTSSSTGNTILNFGGAYIWGKATGIYCNYQWEQNISYNTLNSNNGSVPTPEYDIYGIQVENGQSSNYTINGNAVSVKGCNYLDWTRVTYGIYLKNSGTPLSSFININNNTLTNCSSYNDFTAIYCMVDATTVNINSNTISGYSPSGTPSRQNIYGIYFYKATTLPMNLSMNNNSVGSMTQNSSDVNSDGDTYLTGISGAGQITSCSGNIVHDITMYGNNLEISFRGISCSAASYADCICQNNVVRDISVHNSIYSHATGISASNLQGNQVYNISLYGEGTISNGLSSGGQVINNLVHNIKFTCNGSTTGSMSLNGIIAGRETADANTPQLVTGNQVYDLSQVSGNKGTISGIYSSGADLQCSIYKNNIYNLYCTNTGTTIYGVYLTNSAGAIKTLYDNTISDLRATNSALTNAIIGVFTGINGTYNCYYNTIFLNTNSTATTFGTTAFYASTGGTLDLRNNIIVNTSIPNGGAYTCAYRRSSTTQTSYSSLSNNNLFYAGTPGLYRLIFSDSTNMDQTLSAFKTRVAPRDAASVTENPPFINSTTQPYNLHLSTTTPTQCESEGTRITTPVSITTDFDGDIRWGEMGYSGTGSAPDIGADEGNFIPRDVNPPAITYTLLSNSCSTGDRYLTATITDMVGVPITGSLVPRIYFKKNSGAWHSRPGTLTSGIGFNGTWSLPIVAADMGGVASTDVISYYVIAQDIATPPNIGANPSTGFVATDVNTVVTPPTTPNSFIILNLLTGTIQVGAGKTFATLTAAAAAYNNASYCLNGSVVFELTDPLYSTSETFPVVFNSNPSAGPGNTLTIRPASGITPTITGLSGTSILKFNSAKYIIIDGSNTGGSDRNLSITNTMVGGSTAAVWVASLATNNGSTNITIKNCNLSCGINSTNSFGIYAGSATSMGSIGNDNDYLTIQNNNIFKVYSGITVAANSSGQDDNLVITQNSLGGLTTDNYLGHDGISVTECTGVVISGNTVNNVTNAATNPVGISLGNGVSSTVVEKNTINNIKYTGSSTTYGGRGIYVNPGYALSNITIKNNLVFQISGMGSTTVTASNSGIMIDGTSGGINICYNSVYLSGTSTVLAAIQSSALVINSTLANGLDIRDNIFQNSQLNNGNSGSVAYAVYSAVSSTVYSNINYNDYFAGGSQGCLGYLGSAKTTLALWQTATGKDANSINADPLFVSVSDLTPGMGGPVIGTGVSISGITTDYLGVTRNNPPTVGAYENGIDVLGPVISYTPFGNTASLLARTLIATIVDPSGVPTSGSGLPVLYWRKNTDSWISQPGVSVGGNQFQFTFGSGVSSGDIISYYIVAQDGQTPVPFLNSNPSAGVSGMTYNPPAAATPPTTPYSYRVLISFSGDIIIGAGGDYTSLTGSGGLFNAINNNVFAGNVTAYIASDLTEDGTNVLNQWTEYGGSNYTLTIRSLDNSEHLISGNVSNGTGMITINGADRVLLTGLFSGAGTYLHFRNTSTTCSTIRFQNSADNTTFENCIVESSNASVSGAISIAGSTGNHDVIIRNCVIRDRSDAAGTPMYGIYSTGSAGNNNNITITNNEIANFSSIGIFIESGGNGNNWTISNNSLYNNMSTPPSGAQTSIYFSPGSTSNGNLISGNYIGGRAAFCGGGSWVNSGANTFTGISISSGTLTGTSVQGNTIQAISQTSTGMGAFYGIYALAGNNAIGTTTGNIIGSPTTPGSIIMAGTGIVYAIFSNATSTIKHNIISNITQTANVPGIFYGIYLMGNYPILVDANSIFACGATSSSVGSKDVTGIYFAGAGSGTQPCIISNNLITLGDGITNNNVYKGIDDFGISGNNLSMYFISVYLSGTCTGSSNSYAFLKRALTNETQANNIYYNNRSGGTGIHYSIGNTTITSGTFSSNYNDLYAAGAMLAIWNAANQADLAAWRTASGQDANSKSINPSFVSVTDLHPANMGLDAAGTAVSGITTDYAGVTRGNPPDIGAYEIGGSPYATTEAATDITTSTATLHGTVNPSGLSIAVSFEYGLTPAYGSTVTATPTPVTGTAVIPVSAAISGLAPATTYHYRTKGIGGTQPVYGSDLTFTTTAVAMKTLNLVLLLEGMYSGSGTMTQASDASGPHFGAGIADKIAIELHDGANYSTLIQSFSNIDLHTAGTATITVPAVYGGSYYITIKHRNSVATVSSAPVSFAGSVISYSFTDAQNKAFGNNLKPTTDGRFTFYGGDINQDDILDGSDMSTVDNLTAAYVSGYLPEDVNGDGIIDGSDMAVIDNNTALYVAAVFP